MRVLVVGAGAVGSWIGGSLAHGGADVVLAEPGPHRAVLADRGITLLQGARSVSVRPVVEATVSEALASGAFDLTVVAVRSYHTSAVADELAASGATGRIASFQNGVGNDEVLAAALPEASFVLSTLTTGLTIDASQGVVRAADNGGVGIGLTMDGPPVDDIVAALALGGLNVRTYDDPVAMKWSKLLLNSIGSATCAVLGWPPARVFSDQRLFEIERRALLEAVAVMRAIGLTAVALPGYPVPLFVHGARWLPPTLSFRLFAGRLAGARGDRLPSVACDLAEGRSRTENSVLSGAVAREGERAGVPVPVTRALAQLVDSIASRHVDRSTYAGRPERLLSHLGVEQH